MKEDILIEARNHAYVDHPIPLSVLCDLIVEVEKLREENKRLRNDAKTVGLSFREIKNLIPGHYDPDASKIMKDCSSLP